MHFHTTAAISLAGLLLGGLAAAADRPPVPGSYRPTDNGQIQATPGNHQQFIPTRPGNSRYPATAPSTYAPQDYWNNNTPATTAPPPGISITPGQMNPLPYGYPNLAAPAPVAPVYDPPIPGAAPPGWGYHYGAQPAYAQPTYSPPAPPAYSNAQSGVSTPNSAVPAADAYSSRSASTQALPAATLPPPVEPTPSGQGRGRTTIKTAPRPFSNPQEGGQAFIQRSNPIKTTYGGNDNRFRPPELKGTP
ncbi:hypothetical protein [Thiolapillus sp.]